MTENIRYLSRINQLSEDDMRDYILLHRILETEMQKSPKDMDLDLIDECFAQIDELVGEGPKQSQSALQAKIKEITATPTGKVTRTIHKARRRNAVDTKNRHRARNFWIAFAACLVLLFSSVSVAAHLQGYNNAWDFITHKFIEIFNLDAGESLDTGNITLIMEDERVSYASVDDMLRTENLNILYPSYIPEGTSLQSVRKYINDDGTYKYVFMFSNEAFSIMIKNHYTYSTSNVQEWEEHDMGDFQFYVKDLKNNAYQAVCQLNGFEYVINHNDYAELIQIIESMKGQAS